jgi:hypothetical protein
MDQLKDVSFSCLGLQQPSVSRLLFLIACRSLGSSFPLLTPCPFKFVSSPGALSWRVPLGHLSNLFRPPPCFHTQTWLSAPPLRRNQSLPARVSLSTLCALRLGLVFSRLTTTTPSYHHDELFRCASSCSIQPLVQTPSTSTLTTPPPAPQFFGILINVQASVPQPTYPDARQHLDGVPAPNRSHPRPCPVPHLERPREEENGCGGSRRSGVYEGGGRWDFATATEMAQADSEILLSAGCGSQNLPQT